MQNAKLWFKRELQTVFENKKPGLPWEARVSDAW